MMKSASPKYVPREWILKAVYDDAYQGASIMLLVSYCLLGTLLGNFDRFHQFHLVLTRPYDELPEMHDL